MSAADLLLKLGFDNSQFQRGLAQSRIIGNKFAGDLSHDLSSKLQGAFSGAAVIAGLEEFGRAVVEHVARIKDLSEQYQINTDEVQKVDIATNAVGLRFEDFGQVLFKVQAARKSAVEGNKDLRATFERLGFSMDQVNSGSISALDFTKRLTQGMEEGKISGEEQAAILEVIGIRSGKLISVIQELNKVQHKPIIDPGEVDRIDKANKKLEEFWRLSKVIGADVIGPILEHPVTAILSGGKSAVAEAAAKRIVPKGAPVQGPDIGLEQFSKIGTHIAKDGEVAAQFKTDLESIVKLQEATRKLDFAKLSTKERELQIQREITSLVETANNFDELSQSERNDLLTQAKEKELELLNLQTPRRESVRTDPLVRVGNFLGSSDDRPLQRLDRIYNQLASLNSKAAETNRELKDKL